MKLIKDLYELKEIDAKVKSKLDYIKSNPDIMVNNINEVKALKNDMYVKASKAFIYNLKKLIQLESTQKNLAKKICISEDLLSKYKSAEAFPSIETLIYICEVYNLSMDKLIGMPLSLSDIRDLEYNKETEFNPELFMKVNSMNIFVKKLIEFTFVYFWGVKILF
jgi:transcriptional regulator with XRE-family HTH domain